MARKRSARARQNPSSSSVRGLQHRWGNIEYLVEGNGDITVGRIGPIQCAATAADDHQMVAALVCRDGESFEELLDRLDAALARFWEDDVLTDEING